MKNRHVFFFVYISILFHRPQDDKNNSHLQVILPNLSLMQLISVAKQDPTLDEVVNDYFFFGAPDVALEIDEKILSKFPIQRHRALYKNLGEKTETLTLSNVTESQATQVLCFFGATKILTLKEMKILNTKALFPNRLKSLTVVHCKFNREFFEGWCQRLARTLETLHLHRLAYDFPISGEPTFLPSLINLRSLTITDMAMERFDYNLGKIPLESLTLRRINTRSISIRVPDNNKLRFLEIESPAEMFLSGEFSLLRSVSLRCANGRTKRNHLGSLKCEKYLRSLIYNQPFDVDQAVKYKNLTCLKVPCNWYDEEELLEKLKSLDSLKTIKLICHPPTPEFNWTDVLGEDQLRMILKYLTTEDCLTLGRVYPRLLSLVDAQTHNLTIDQMFLNKFPMEQEENTEMYENLGEGLRVLKVAALKEEDFLRVMDRFPKIRELQLERMELNDLEGVSKVPKVKKLKIGYSPGTASEYWSQLFRHLDENLESLSIEETLFPLLELHNLRDFSSEGYSNAETMKTFLLQNDKLKRINLFLYRSSDSFLPLEFDAVPLSLHSITLSVVKFEQVKSIVEVLHKENLKSLEISSRSYKEGFLGIIAPFLKLERLNLDMAVDWTDELVEGLSKFKDLTFLRINGTISGKTAMDIVRQLPRLKKLQLGSHVTAFTFEFEDQLLRFLKRRRRVLSIIHGDPSVRWESNSLN